MTVKVGGKLGGGGGGGGRGTGSRVSGWMSVWVVSVHGREGIQVKVGCPGKITINRPLWIAGVNDPPAGKAGSFLYPPKTRKTRKISRRKEKKARDDRERKQETEGEKTGKEKGKDTKNKRA